MAAANGLIVAVGGNALIGADEAKTIAQQYRRAEETLRRILPLVEQHEHVLIVHGNGPQVGNELLRSEIAEAQLFPLPLDVLVACVLSYLEEASGADGRSALITSPEALGEALAGSAGTRVRP